MIKKSFKLLKKDKLSILFNICCNNQFYICKSFSFNFNEKRQKIEISNKTSNLNKDKLNSTNIIKSNNVIKTREEYLKEITENNKEISFLNKISSSIKAISNFKIAMVGFSPFFFMFISTSLEVCKIMLLGQSDFLEYETNKILSEKLNFNSLMFKMCLVSNLSFNFYLSGLKISQYTKDMNDLEKIYYSEEGFDKGTYKKLLLGIKEFIPIFLMFLITFFVIKYKYFDYKCVLFLVFTNILNSYKIKIGSISELLKKIRVFNLVGCVFIISLYLLNMQYFKKFNMNIMIDEEDENSIKEVISMKKIIELENDKLKKELDLILENEEICLNIYE